MGANQLVIEPAAPVKTMLVRIRPSFVFYQHNQLYKAGETVTITEKEYEESSRMFQPVESAAAPSPVETPTNQPPVTTPPVDATQNDETQPNGNAAQSGDESNGGQSDETGKTAETTGKGFAGITIKKPQDDKTTTVK